MKKSTPTPLWTIFSAIFFQPGCSVINSFVSFSAFWSFPSFLKKSLPGPQVGSVDKEHTIFPPVEDKADRAAFSVGRRAGSGFLTCAKRLGNCVNKVVITSL